MSYEPPEPTPKTFPDHTKRWLEAEQWGDGRIKKRLARLLARWRREVVLIRPYRERKILTRCIEELAKATKL